MSQATSTLQDSGARSEFTTGAVRDASIGKGIPSEIYPDFLLRLAVLLEQGAIKYDRGNWRKGIPLSRYLDGIMRHSLKASMGWTDEDHLAAVAFNVMGWTYTADAIKSGELPESLNDLPFYQGASIDLDRSKHQASEKTSRFGAIVGRSWRAIQMLWRFRSFCGLPKV